MTLSTLAALLIFAATAAPGRVFERGIDKSRPRHHRSTAAEYTEWLIIGATTSLLALLIVGLVADLTSLFDAGAFLEGPGKYAEQHTAVVIGCGFATILLSFAIAYCAARLISLKTANADGSSSYTQHTTWYDSFETNRPDGKAVRVALEFTDGLQASGVLRGFTPVAEDDRELLLKPYVLRRPGQVNEPKVVDDGFLIVREGQVKLMTGTYGPATDE